MSLISDYEARTAWKYEPIRGRFDAHPGLAAKIDAGGRCRPFPGSTVVFRLDKPVCDHLAAARDFLHARVGDMLAEPLPASTFHVTLHDLLNPDVLSADDPEYADKINDSLKRAADIVEAVSRECAGQAIAMAADRVVNMVSKSLVLMLRPRTEADFERLLALYHRFDAILPLSYPLTPHVTLAYFRPGALDGDRLGEAVAQLQPDAADPMPVNLSIAALTAQRFEDMRRYVDVPLRLCFLCDGGMNRSVMAAAILNHRAHSMGLSVACAARAADPRMDGQPVPEIVRETLERHGIPTDAVPERARFLRREEYSAFSGFAALSASALGQIGFMEPERLRPSAYFLGVPDPQYETTWEEAFLAIDARVERFLSDI